MFEFNADRTFFYLRFSERMIGILIWFENTFVDLTASVLATVCSLYEFLSFGLLIHRSSRLSSPSIHTM